MEFIIFTIFFLIGLAIASFTIIPILIILKFGIPFTKTLEKKGVLNKNNGIVKGYLITLLILPLIFLSAITITFIFFSTYLIGFLIGVGMTLLFGIGQIGENENNIKDYFQTNEKHLNNTNIDKLYGQSLGKGESKNELKDSSSTMELPKFFDVDGTLVKLELDSKTGEVVSSTSSGHPYGIGKTMSEGTEISEKEFNRLSTSKK